MFLLSSNHVEVGGLIFGSMGRAPGESVLASPHWLWGLNAAVKRMVAPHQMLATFSVLRHRTQVFSLIFFFFPTKTSLLFLDMV